MSNIFILNWKDILGAVISAVIIAVLTYVGNLTDLTQFNVHQVLTLMITVATASLLKSLTTDSNGNFAGVIPVK